MSGRIRLVETFMQRWALGMDEFYDAIREVFTSHTVWENVGYSMTTGAEAAIDHLRDGAARLGYARVDAEVLAIAEAGDRVLTERIDHHYDAHGGRLFSVRAMSVFEVTGDRITAIREYFDTARFLTQAGLKTGTEGWPPTGSK